MLEGLLVCGNFGILLLWRDVVFIVFVDGCFFCWGWDWMLRVRVCDGVIIYVKGCLDDDLVW